MGMTAFDTPKKVLDEFHSFMGSGLAMDYHINGLPEKILVEELAQRDTQHRKAPDRDMYKKYLHALYAQKKLLCTKEGKIFIYTDGRRKILEEMGLVLEEKPSTRWKLVLFLIIFTALIVFISKNGL
jgi:hypothetical protein